MAGAIRKNLNFNHLGGDLVGGITAAVVALPLALAFGVASGLGATAGLYGAIACGIFASLFGGTPGQVSGPTGPMTVVAAEMILTHHDRPELVFAAIIFAGLFQILLGSFKSGQLVHYIPYPVVSGFMTGIGMIIIVLEIPPLFGLKGASGVLSSLNILPQIPLQIDWAATIIGLGSLLTILALKKVGPKIPAALAALVMATTATVLLGLDIPVIGEIPSGLPVPHIPAINLLDLRLIVEGAFALALLGSLDSLLTSVVVDRITNRRHDSNQELVGQGIGNMVSGLIGGLPGAGATMRSVVNIHSGGVTNLSGIIHGFLLLGVLLGLGSLTESIPLACLAGILVHVGITIVDYRGIKSIPRIPRSDTLVMLVVLGLTVFLDLIVAVLVGIALASVLFVKNLSDVKPSAHGPIDPQHLPEGFPESLHNALYFYTFKGPLYFGEAKNFSTVMAGLQGVQYVLLEFDHVPLIDQTGAFTVEDTIEQLHAQGITVLLIHPYPHVRASLERIANRPEVFAQTDCSTIGDALSRIRQLENAKNPG